MRLASWILLWLAAVVGRGARVLAVAIVVRDEGGGR